MYNLKTTTMKTLNYQRMIYTVYSCNQNRIFDFSSDLSSVQDSFIDDIACLILDPRNRAFSMPYSVIVGFGAKIV